MKHARTTALALGTATLGLAIVACSAAPEPPKPGPAPSSTSPSIAPTTPATAAPAPSLPVLPGETTPIPTPTTTPTPVTPQTGCTPAPGDPCDQCLSAACCNQVLACEGNADCVAVDACGQQCRQYGESPQADQCYQLCDSQHPVGYQYLSAVWQCAESACAAQCQ